MSHAALEARMADSNGWGITDSVLTVTDQYGQQVTRVLADHDGAAATGPLSPGTYTAILTAPGFRPLAKTVVVGNSGTGSLGVATLTRDGGLELPPPGPWTIDPAHSSITVTARHMALSSVRGRFTDFKGRIDVREPTEASTVHAVIQAASIDTASKMRDDHLRSADFLEVDKFPVITFVGSSVRRRGADEWEVVGELRLHGRSRAIRLDMNYLGTGPDPWGGTRAAFRAKTRLDRNDFAIDYNAMVKVGVGIVGTTLGIELDIQAVQGDSLPET